MKELDNRSNWLPSAAGNLWRYCQGRHLVVGKCKAGPGYWARVDGVYINETLPTEKAAKSAAVVEALLSLLGK
jgi:hypothetical protein